MYQINQSLLDYYKGIVPAKGYIYYFLNDNLKSVPRDQLKIGIGFYRSKWLDGTFLFEADAYFLKSLKDFLAAQYLKKGGFNVWSEWTYYHARLWAAVGISRLMGTGSFYLTGHGPTMILRKRLDEIPAPIAIAELDDSEPGPTKEGYLVYRDPGGGAHLRNWKLFYVVLGDILKESGLEDIQEEILEEMSFDAPESRAVFRVDEVIYGFPSQYRVEKIDEEQASADMGLVSEAHLNDWLATEAQFDAGGFTEEFKAYYTFMLDHYGREDELSDVLSLVEHGISWVLAVLPDDIRDQYKNRYYDLVKRFSTHEKDAIEMYKWLDQITSVKVPD